MRLIDLMFSSVSDENEVDQLADELTCHLSDLQCWGELSDNDRLVLFGKLVSVKQAVDHCLRVNYKCDPNTLPKRLEDVPGADELSPWNLPKPVMQHSVDALAWVKKNGFGLKGGDE